MKQKYYIDLATSYCIFFTAAIELALKAHFLFVELSQYF